MHRDAVTLANGVTLSFAGRGAGPEPVLVLVPGPTDSWRSYEPVLEHLPPTRRAVALSPRGHGDSDKPASGFGIHDYAGDLVLALDALGIDRAVLAGHSGSCLVVRRVAIDHPARVAGLILEASPSTLVESAALRTFVDTVVADLRDPISRSFARQVVTDTSSPDLPAARLDELVEEVLKVPARVWQETFAALLEYDDRGELGRVAAPVLLIHGDADPLVTTTMQDDLARRFPYVERTRYAGVGHTPRWEEPARFAADVVAFSTRLRED
jgi:pimeloyl-ACP methyl ester carboxylesterase